MERATRTETVLSHEPREKQRWLKVHTLVSKIGSVRLVEIEWQVLDPDDLQGSSGVLNSLEKFWNTYIVGVWNSGSDICHDSDHHVLLGIESPRVETPCVVEGGELPGREDRFQKLTSREGKQLSDVGRNCDTRRANIEELVDERSMNQSISEYVSTVGFPRLRNDLTYPAATKIVPMNQARKVLAGIVESSWLSTTARTSAYGEF